MAMLLWPPDVVQAILEGRDPEPALMEAARLSPCDAQLWRDRVPFCKGLVWAMNARGTSTPEGKIAQQYIDLLRREYPGATQRADCEWRLRLNDPSKSTACDRLCGKVYGE